VTWIVGLTGMMTCGALAGDVRVTTAAGHSFDGVQKVHLITRSAAVGFAGTVRFGLRAVDDMKRYALAESPEDFSDGINGWSRRIQEAWDRDSDVTAGSDLHLLVMTSRPKVSAAEDTALSGVVMADVSTYILRSPGFSVEPVPFGRAAAIGSGQAYEKLNEQLASIEGEIDGLLRFEFEPAFLAVGGVGAPLRIVLAEAIAGINVRDVSEHLHMGVVKPRESRILTFDIEALTPGAVSRRMPNVATNEDEWDVVAAEHHVADAVA
jgi:hypothetical protein